MSWERPDLSFSESPEQRASVTEHSGAASEERHPSDEELNAHVELISSPWLDSVLGAFSFGYVDSLRAPRLCTAKVSYVKRSLNAMTAVDDLQESSAETRMDIFLLEQRAQACRDAMVKLSEVGVPNQVLLPTRGDKIDEFVAVALRYLLPHRRTECAKVVTLIDEMIARYFNVAYHHVGHAALVCHNAVEIARLVGVWRLMSSDEKVAFSLIGLGHDMGHPGKGVNFLKSIGHPLTKLYNDNSPLENYHAASLLQLLERPDCNVFAHLCKGSRPAVRRLLIQGILWTDLTEHPKYLATARSLLGRAAKSKEVTPILDNEELRRAALAMVVKASDLGYMSLEPPVVMLQWAIDFYTEVFAQTALEEELDCLSAASVNLSQLGTSSWFLRNSQFITSVVIPIGTFLGELEWRIKDPRRGGVEEEGAWDPKQLTLAYSQVSLIRALNSQEDDVEGLARRVAEVEACGYEGLHSAMPATPTFRSPVKKYSSSNDKQRGWWPKALSPPAISSPSRYRKTNAWMALVEPSQKNADLLRKVRYFVHPT